MIESRCLMLVNVSIESEDILRSNVLLGYIHKILNTFSHLILYFCFGLKARASLKSKSHSILCLYICLGSIITKFNHAEVC